MLYQTHQFDPKMCPNCQRPNAALALVCAHCGTALPVLDEAAGSLGDAIRARLAVISQKVQEAYEAELGAGALVLHLPANDASIILKGARQLILGRPGATVVTDLYDLTPFDAYQLGVSRQHAQLMRAITGYTIMDLGSANGTWVNTLRLDPRAPQPVQNGDQIWLGQLIVLAYLPGAPAGS